MTLRHPVVDSAFPPGDGTLSGRLMLDVALGLDDTDDILDDLEELLEDGEFHEFYPDDKVPTVREVRTLLADVVAEHNRLVTETSPQRDAFFAALRALTDRDVLASFSGTTLSDAVGDAFQLATELQDEGEEVRGFVFSHRQDLERLITDDHLPWASARSRTTTPRRRPSARSRSTRSRGRGSTRRGTAMWITGSRSAVCVGRHPSTAEPTPVRRSTRRHPADDAGPR